MIQILEKMSKITYDTGGVGLAAIQIGLPLWIIVIDAYDKEVKKEKGREITNEDRKNLRFFINPKIEWYSPEIAVMSEGYLSFPGVVEKLNPNGFESKDKRKTLKAIRSLKVKITYNDLDMNLKTLEADGLLAHCLQHEIDHMNGIVYIQRLSESSKKDAKKLFPDSDSIKKIDDRVKYSGIYRK